DLEAKGVIFTDMETAAKEHGELVGKHLMSVVTKDENKLTALHAAMFTGGVFLYVPKNVVVDQPLQALFLSDDAEAAFSPHILIVAEANSSVTYVDNYISGGDAKQLVHNGIVEVVAKPGAQVQFATVHNLNSEITDLTYRRALLEQDASINWVIGEM